MPYELGALTPLLAWSYRQQEASGILFPLVRVICSLAVVFIPALALGATFPAAIRAFVRESPEAGSSVGMLYAANTTGGALGAVFAGFVLIPAVGVFATTLVGMAAGLLSAGTAVLLARRLPSEQPLGAIRVEEPRPTPTPRSNTAPCPTA